MSETGTQDVTDEGFLQRLKQFEGASAGEPVTGPDPVNAPMIRHMVEALGDQNPIYVDEEAARAVGHDGIVAPPTMMQTWSMAGLGGKRRGEGTAEATGRDAILNQLDDAGFTSVVATNCEQEYFRYLKPGDRITVTSTVESVSEQKATGLGVGHFVTTRDEYRDQHGELVGTHMFRILKFKPGTGKSGAAKPNRPKRPRVSVTRDNAFWFEGAKEGKLLIQRCASCGTLRHPPGPMCANCRSLEWDALEASGRGTVYSFTVNHYPQVPAFDYPLAVVLVELEEGTRLVSNLIDVAPEDVEIGMPVQVEFVQFDEDLTLPQFRKVG